ncbi:MULTISPECIES: hypothetical protein [unclassified Pseudomonas]|uniref:hypothetical protein n=1 Tax=unclassified Pseudomonas TaxID=196821 RepID=UPI000C2F86C0|nr:MULTISPECIES: hypothetical protein [unclassified Pseudomonas]MCU1740841.1 hypothetical protein [Pseudomonas sp. 20S_6.2_Bac1]
MWRLKALAGVLLLLSSNSWAENVLYRTQQPVELGAARTEVALRSSSGAGKGGLLAWKGARPLALALSGIWALEAPAAGYRLYLNLPPSVQPDDSDPGYLGDVSFYGAPDHFDTQRPKEVAFLLDETLARLRKAGRLAALPTLTLIPVAIEEQGRKPRIEAVSIVETPH